MDARWRARGCAWRHQVVSLRSQRRGHALPRERGVLLARVNRDPEVLEREVVRATLDDDPGQVRHRRRHAVVWIAIRERMVDREVVGVALEQEHGLAEREDEACELLHDLV